MAHHIKGHLKGTQLKGRLVLGVHGRLRIGLSLLLGQIRRGLAHGQCPRLVLLECQPPLQILNECHLQLRTTVDKTYAADTPTQQCLALERLSLMPHAATLSCWPACNHTSWKILRTVLS